jgi:D-lactate dehydrogenase
MKVVVFSAKPYDRDYLDAANLALHDLTYFDTKLDQKSAMLARGFDAICTFVNDSLNNETLHILKSHQVRLIVLRCAGFNNVDIVTAQRLGIAIGRVPSYSPEAVAEHAMALMLSLNRHVHRAYSRVREGNFSLDGMIGFNMQGRTVGLVGVGKIGLALARILRGFGCSVLGVDPVQPAGFSDLGGRYVTLPELLREADIITLHCPLTTQTRHLIDGPAIAQMKQGVMLINTSRGAIIDTAAVINGLKRGKIGLLGLDVYEEEEAIFYEDYSDQLIQDDVFARLLTFPNVLVTSHQAYFTKEAMEAIAMTTISNITSFANTGTPVHPVKNIAM